MKISRREMLGGVLAGGGVVLLAPTVPGCSRQPPPRTGPPAGGDGAGRGGTDPHVARLQQLFGVDGDVARRVLDRALQRGGELADIFLEHRVSDSLKLEEGKVNVAAASIKLGAGVRVVVGDQSGYAYTENLTEEDLLRAAETAALIARGKPRQGPRDFRSVRVESRYRVETVPTEVPVADKMKLLRRADAAARAASGLTRVVVVHTSNEHRRVLLYRSDGLVAADERPYTALGCMVTVQRGQRTERNWYNEGGMREMAAFFDEERVDGIAREAVRRATLSLEAVVPPAGEMPVVLGPGYSGILLHEAIGHGLEADFNRKELSIYSGRVGEKVASGLCTVVDDGTVRGSRGALNVDDEGTAGQKTVLIERGVLRGYMTDLISAGKLSAPATGNGRRQSYRFQPLPRMTTTYLLAGKHGKEEMFEGVERGIYALDFTNGQVNIGAGDYTFFVNYGYLIEHGKVTRPIKDVNIIGNGPQSLQRVDRVGADLLIPDTGSGWCGKGGQRVPVNFGLPHVRISRATVGGRGAAGGKKRSS